MKLMIIFLCFLLAGCVTHSYTKQDKILLSAMWAASAADYYQTDRILEDDEFVETNSSIQDDTDAAALILGVPLALTIGGLWIPPKYRKWFFGAFTGVKTAAVIHNHNEGVR